MVFSTSQVCMRVVMVFSTSQVYIRLSSYLSHVTGLHQVFMAFST